MLNKICVIIGPNYDFKYVYKIIEKYPNTDFIGVETGSLYLKKNKIKAILNISDFDTWVDGKTTPLNNKIIKTSNDITDLEFAIKIAKDKQYETIVCIVDGPRWDHTYNNLLLVINYNIHLYNSKSFCYTINNNKWVKIYKNNYKYLSFINIYHDSLVSTKGLKWNVKNYQSSSISNEIISLNCYIMTKKSLIIIQSN